MGSNWPLAFLEFFVVIAFGVVYLVVDRVAKRAAEKYRTDASSESAGEQRGDRGAPSA